MSDNLKERLTDMSVLASTRTPADALQYIEELEAKLSESEALLAKAVAALDAIKLYSFDEDACRKARTTLAELTGGNDE